MPLARKPRRRNLIDCFNLYSEFGGDGGFFTLCFWLWNVVVFRGKILKSLLTRFTSHHRIYRLVLRNSLGLFHVTHLSTKLTQIKIYHMTLIRTLLVPPVLDYSTMILFPRIGDTAVRLPQRLTFFDETTSFSYYEVYKLNEATENVK